MTRRPPGDGDVREEKSARNRASTGREQVPLGERKGKSEGGPHAGRAWDSSGCVESAWNI